MKVLLINPPVRKKMKAQEIPIGLGMIAAIAKQEGHQLAFLDLNVHRVSLQIAAQEIAIDDYDEGLGILYIRMGGGCHGCASSTVTLKLMITAALKDKFPGIESVEDATDHAAGQNPYY